MPTSMDEPDKTQIQLGFGKRVREIRSVIGISQEQLAFESGLERSYIGQVERGERNISIVNIHRIAKALKTEAYFLLMPIGSTTEINQA